MKAPVGMHEKKSGPLNPWFNPTHAIATDAEVTITELGSLGWGEHRLLGMPIVNQDEIIAEALILAECDLSHGGSSGGAKPSRRCGQPSGANPRA